MDGKIVDSVDSDESKSSHSTSPATLLQNGSFRMLLILKPTAYHNNLNNNYACQLCKRITVLSQPSVLL